MKKPKITFRTREELATMHHSARWIELEGRAGLNFTSIRGRAQVPMHTLAEDNGTLVLWVLPLQDLFPAWHDRNHGMSNPSFDRFVFLSDREAVQDIEAASFALMFHTGWHPVLLVKFQQGSVADTMFHGPQGAIATAGHFEMRSLCWYQMVVTWDRPEGIYRIYANGVLVGHSDVTASALPHDLPAPSLFFGNPALAIGDLEFYDEALEAHEVGALFEAQAKSVNPEVQESLSRTYEGNGLPCFNDCPREADGWRTEMDLSLKERAHFSQFILQGCGTSVRFAAEGFRIITPGFDEYLRTKGREPRDLDLTRMYLFTRQIFDGDIYVSFEFRLNEPGGLALLMTQIAGMQGEDFMEDYRLRSTGSMSMVCWEDVRNYHWEFYREMVDTRNDLVSHACLKNPWDRPMHFQIEPRRWELDRWYRLEYLQEGARLRGVLDGKTVMDVTDNAFDNNGPVLQHGRVAFRAMMRTDLVLRNWKIQSRPRFKIVK